jgi:hypothetical protein
VSTVADELAVPIVVTTVDPYVSLRVESALWTTAYGPVYTITPRELRDLLPVRGFGNSPADDSVFLTNDSAAEALRHSSVVILVPAESLLELGDQLRLFAVIGYGTAEALDEFPPGTCDDYLVAPWSDSELRYRVARMAHRRVVVCNEGTFAWGRNWIAGRQPFHPPEYVNVSTGEYRLLDILAGARGEVVDRTLLMSVAGSFSSSASRALDMRISRLRKHIREATPEWRNRPAIRCCKGRGYQFTCT